MSEKKNRKEIRKPYLAPRRSRPTPAQPAHRGRGVFFPLPRLQAARWNATELAGDDTSSSRSFQAPRGLFSHLDAPWRRRELFPPSPVPILLSLAEPREEQDAAVAIASSPR